MTPTERMIIQTCIKEKADLVEKIELQCADDIAAGVLWASTTHQLNLARDNFSAARLQLGESNLEKCLYFIMRGSWNLGEFMAMSRANKQNSLSTSDSPESEV